MNRYLLFGIAVMLLVSCGRHDAVQSVLTPPDRTGGNFSTPLALFSGFPDLIFTDGDVSAILNGPGTGSPGTAWVDGNGIHWTAS